jgi:2-polyprenyl-3-methyl-5-hydroxy-6-metoxy-1,4-benzoquinol methylase
MRMDESWIAQYPDFERNHFWWKVRRDVVDALIEQRAGRRSLEVLDIGCGTGVTLERLADRHSVTGLEASPVAVANSVLDGRILNATVETAVLDSSTYDVVLMMDVLEHLDDPMLALRRAADWSREDGLLIASVPAHRWLWTSHDDINEHRARYNKSTLTRMLIAGGWEPVLVRYVFALLVPPKVIQVALERSGINREAGRPSIPHPLLNRIAYWSLRGETAFALGPLGHWWIGTSVFALATPSTGRVGGGHQ